MTRTRETSVLKKSLRAATATFLRIGVIFAFLTVFADSMTRIYYSYMPMETWIGFQSVTVENRDGEAVAIIKRKVKSPRVATFYRSLVITYPQHTRACTSSLLTVLDDLDDEIVIPMRRLLSATCPDALQGKKAEGRLQVSYIFDFPYGVKRSAVRYSPEFSIFYSRGTYSVSTKRSDG